ncbi:MAG: efflux RND transporter periplasmic adaptor subunit [Salinivirgaceae bacterium]
MNTIDKKTIIIAVATLVVGILIGWLLLGSGKTSSDAAHQHTDTEVANETTWTCSMHPQVRKSEPGDCPICGMDLIPLEEDEQNGELDPDAVSMSATAMQLASVSTAIVEETNPVKHVRLNGKVQPDERLVYTQSTHIPGRVEQLSVNFTGEYIKNGQTIAHIYSPELVTAQEELFEAHKISETEPQLLNAAKEKLKNWKLTDKQIDQLLDAGEIKEKFPVQADVSGYVTRKIVNQGNYVRTGEPLFEIADLSNVWVLFDLYETDMPWVEKGDNVTFTLTSFPGAEFEGVISFIDPVIDPATRVAKARVEYGNATGKLKPEMFASGVVQAELTGQSNSVVVPKSAVMWTGKRSVVYIKTESEQRVSFMMREVTLGPTLGDSYIIESGIEPGEEIAVSGTFSVDAAAQLAGKPSMMSPSSTSGSERKPGGGKAMSGHNHGGESTWNGLTGTEEKPKPEKAKPLTIGKKAKEALQPLYTAYLQWKDALVADQFSKAQKHASDMKSALSNIDMNVFKGDAHNAWMNYQQALNKNLEHVHHYANIEDLRKAFQPVSASMIEMTAAFKPLGKTIFVQHCPMADNNKGADWLSTERDVKNPYYGSSMLTCGEVTKELK